MIDLYYWTTPNGHKITIFLEETGLPYNIMPVNIGKGEQFKADFFFNATANTEIYTLSLHDALPISVATKTLATSNAANWRVVRCPHSLLGAPDRKSTRLNSSHSSISYAVFCLK